jgi:hypothetical protein
MIDSSKAKHNALIRDITLSKSTTLLFTRTNMQLLAYWFPRRILCRLLPLTRLPEIVMKIFLCKTALGEKDRT